MLNPDVVAVMREEGWPTTKAAYVAAIFWPLAPTFPLDAAVVGQVPARLPGEFPESLADLAFTAGADMVDDEPPLPEPLIESGMRRHGFTRERAIEMIRAHGG